MHDLKLPSSMTEEEISTEELISMAFRRRIITPKESSFLLSLYNGVLDARYEKDARVHKTAANQKFTRVSKKDEVVAGRLYPTMSEGRVNLGTYYDYMARLNKEIASYHHVIGFFFGDPVDWVSILLEDERIAESEIRVSTVVFPAGTYYMRFVFDYGYAKGAKEQFVFYPKPVVPVSVKKPGDVDFYRWRKAMSEREERYLNQDPFAGGCEETRKPIGHLLDRPTSSARIKGCQWH